MRLITLGGLALIDDAGEPHPASRHKRNLVLLAVLALANGPVTRERLIELFWSDDGDGQSARHSLSSALSLLRSVLGRHAITMHRAEVVLAPGAVDVDAIDLLAASQARNAGRVIELYRGPFLAGLSLRASPALASWIGDTSTRLSRAMLRAAAVRCAISAAADDWAACAATARIWLDADPRSADAALHLLSALCAHDTRESRLTALSEYDRLVARLHREFNTVPDARVVELARSVQLKVTADWANGATSERTTEGTTAARPLAPTVPTETIVVSGSTMPDPPSSVPRARWLLPRTVGMLAAALVVLVVAATAATRWLPGESDAHSVIAITDIVAAPTDTGASWLETGLAQMIATDLTRYANIEAIQPRRIQDLRLRAGMTPRTILSDAQAADLANRAGATLSVRGNLTRGRGTYALSLIERDVRTGDVVTSFNVVANDPIELADRATSGLLASMPAAQGQSSRAQFADVETPSTEAYQHFVRSEQAGAEGRFAEQLHELDAAIALDSAFGSALLGRIGMARPEDSLIVRRLVAAVRHARFTEWDMLAQAVDSAFHNGEHARSERLAESLVAAYPHDPRAFDLLGGIYQTHGKFAAAISVFERELALDSLGDAAGRGPCVPCTAYAALANVQMFDGRPADAERTVSRWLELQPDLPAANVSLATALAYEGKFAAAADAQRRAIALSRGEAVYAGELLRMLIMGRDFNTADSLIDAWSATNSASALGGEIADARVLLQRERGQLRASIRTLAALPVDGATLFERMDALSRLGDYDKAARLFHANLSHIAPPELGDSLSGTPGPLTGDAARSFAWSRAIEAEAIAGAGDTIQLHALADSIRDVSTRSYYGRDWVLHHHVLGRIAMQGNRYAEAEREFAAAQWGAAGWTANLAWLARAQLAQQHPLDAVKTLRRAYQGPLDAMGRYEPRSELDYLMARAFKAAGESDSAAVYRSYVGAAWVHADPEVRRRLIKLQ